MGSWIFRIITGHSEYSRISPGTSFVQWVACILRMSFSLCHYLFIEIIVYLSVIIATQCIDFQTIKTCAVLIEY